MGGLRKNRTCRDFRLSAVGVVLPDGDVAQSIFADSDGSERDSEFCKPQILFRQDHGPTLQADIADLLRMGNGAKRATIRDVEFQLRTVRCDLNLEIVLAAFFALSYFFASNRSKVVDMIGTYATPILLIALLIIVVMVFAIPIGSPTGGTVDNAFSYSMLTAYNTGDIPTGLICAGVFLGSVKGKGYNTYKEQKYILVRSILVSLTILFVVYGGLCWLGACGTPYFAPDMDQTALLNGLVEMLAGRASLVVLAIAVIFACFTTASGMIATVSDWIIEWTKGKVPYKIVAFVVTFIIFLVAATGVSNVLVISGPLFTLIFPMSVVMTVLGVCKKLVPNDGAWKGAVYVASIISVYDAFVTARSSGLVSIQTDALDNLIAMIPLSEYGFDWLIPTVIGFVVGAVIWKALGKESKPDMAEVSNV